MDAPPARAWPSPLDCSARDSRWGPRLALMIIILAGCPSSSNAPGDGGAASGGSPSTGGAGAGGASASGGGSGGSGGSPGTGGAPHTGGTTGATGGATHTGGTNGATGGASSSSGGRSGSGGTLGSGGTGGLPGTGGGGVGARGGSQQGAAGASGGTSGAVGGRAGAGSGGSAGAGGGSGSPSLLVPAQGVLLGAFVGTGSLAGLEGELGRQVAINHTFVGWMDDWPAKLSGLGMGGRIPLVTWEAWDNSVGAPLTDIASGTYDAMITARAQAAKSFGQKFFQRWGHEMNGNWYPWDGANNGASLAATATFIAAYRHIHDLFVAAGATNALWVFCPNVNSVPSDSWNQWQNYYPGDAYVDWMGFDGYNWGTVQTTSTRQTFPTIAGMIYASLAAKGKPSMVPETASAEQGGDKSAWIGGILPALQATFPAIKAFVWFQMNKETDWRIDSSPAAKAAFLTMANDPFFYP